jgi:hypothetical protein
LAIKLLTIEVGAPTESSSVPYTVDAGARRLLSAGVSEMGWTAGTFSFRFEGATTCDPLVERKMIEFVTVSENNICVARGSFRALPVLYDFCLLNDDHSKDYLSPFLEVVT